jgi:hypothetical protein
MFLLFDEETSTTDYTPTSLYTPATRRKALRRRFR